MAVCGNCGTELEAGQKFCFECGAPVPQTKKCIQCDAELAIKMRFCPECGAPQDGSKSAGGSGLSMGDKNVIAGDVIGHKEETHIAGNATIIKNEDQTKQVKVCHICGRRVRIVDGFDCPSCGAFTCADCYDAESNCCKNCSQKTREQKISRYKEALREALADGKIEPRERKELANLQLELGISTEQARKLESEIKGSGAEKTELTKVEEISLSKAKDLFYKECDAEGALKLAEPVYQSHKEDEKVLDVYLPIVSETDPEKAMEIISGLQIDILTALVTAIGIHIKNKNMTEAEKLLAKGLRFWPESSLLKCWRALYWFSMYKQFDEDSSLFEKAREIAENLGEAKDELELSMQVKTQAILKEEAGEPPLDVDKDFCEQNNMYWQVMTQDFVETSSNVVKACNLEKYIEELQAGEHEINVIGDIDDDCMWDIGVALYRVSSKSVKISLNLKKTVMQEIEEKAFEDCKSLTSVTLPKGLKEIGTKAFYNCKALTSVTLPKGLAQIGESAFVGCDSLTSIVIPESVEKIGISAFDDCPNLTIHAPKGSEAEKYLV